MEGEEHFARYNRGVDSSTVVILDFGAQYTQLIARRIREFNVFSVVLPCTASLDAVKALNPIGIVLSGGPALSMMRTRRRPIAAVLQLGLPTLGICYGMQFMAHHLGGKVMPADKREYGDAVVDIVREQQAV